MSRDHSAIEPLESPFGRVVLQRLPRRRRELLRAWDAADRYLLETQSPLAGRPLVVNDAFGALAVSLADHQPFFWSDSYVAHRALRLNLAANGHEAEAATPLVPGDELPRDVSVVLMKVPRSLALLEYQLARLRPLAAAGVPIRLGGMARHLPRSVWTLAEALIGPARTLPAWRKARVIELDYGPGAPAPDGGWVQGYRLEAWDLQVEAWPGVFSRERFDGGARLLLDTLPDEACTGPLADLGCGNGVLGLVAARRWHDAEIHFVDESWLAIRSAKENFARHFSGRSAHFHWADGLGHFPPGSLQRVLCNPPFHQQQVVSEHIALRMFRQAHRALVPGGQLWVVANRHLDYPRRLRRLFGNCRQMAADRRFRVLVCRR